MNADHSPETPTKKKEVTLLKRITLLALVVVAATLLLASAALAADGARTNYTTVADCMACHNTTDGSFPKPLVQAAHDGWAETGHADPEGLFTSPISRGPGCAGCHTGNYDPTSRIVAMSFCEPRSWTRVLSS